MLSRLVGSFDGSVESIVVSLIDRGELADGLAAKGIRVMTLGMRASSLDVIGLYRAVRLFQRLKPDERSIHPSHSRGFPGHGGIIGARRGERQPGTL